jgi:Holliday junction resolvase RusA-like endonuclease
MKIVIEGPPLAKKRHRCACIGGKPRSYDPQVNDEMKAIRNAIIDAVEISEDETIKKALYLPYSQSYKVGLVFVFPINDRATNSKEIASNNEKLWRLQLHNHKPDLDNLEKLYLDCGKGILWNDDSQITEITHKYKKYGLNPRTEITIMLDHGYKITQKAEQAIKCFSPFQVQQFFDYVAHFVDTNAYSAISFGKVEDLEVDQLQELGNFLYDMGIAFGDEFKRIKKNSSTKSDNMIKESNEKDAREIA